MLNVTPDHLDRHRTLEAYVAAKVRILANQRAEDSAVLNERRRVVCARSAARARGRVLPFRATGFRPGRGAVDAGARSCRATRRRAAQRFALDWREPRRAQPRERWPRCAAPSRSARRSALRARRCPRLPSAARTALELVARRGGVAWVDDSKATNPGAALRALEAFTAPIVWIAGGRAKGLDLGALAEPPRARACARRCLIGEAAPQLERALRGGRPVRARGERRGRGRARGGRDRAARRRRAARAGLRELSISSRTSKSAASRFRAAARARLAEAARARNEASTERDAILGRTRSWRARSASPRSACS